MTPFSHSIRQMSLAAERMSTIHRSARHENRFLFRPRRRLRHLRGIETVGLDYEDGCSVYYELTQRQETLEGLNAVLTSEWATAGRHVEWEALDFVSMDLSSHVMHGLLSGIFEICVYASRDTSSEPVLVVKLEVDLNEVVQVREKDDLIGLYFRLEKGLYTMPTHAHGWLLVEDDPSVRSFPLASPRQILATSRPQRDGVMGDAHSEDSVSTVSQSIASTEGRDTWTDGTQGSKMYNIMERRVDIRRLSSAHKAIEDLKDRRRRLHLHLSDLLRRKRSRVEQMMKLKRLKQSSSDWAIQAGEVERKLDRLKAEWYDQQAKKKTTLQALLLASGNMKGAASRWQDSDASLANQIVPRYKDVHNRLVARRCRLVSYLATVYGLHPYHASLDPSDFPEIDEIVDMQWWNANQNQTSKHFSDKFKTHKRVSNEQGKQRTFLGIVGMDFSPMLSRMAENGFMEWSLSQAQCEAIEAALSYVAAIVTLCSLYLDLSLRYPIKLLGSRSIISLPSPSRLSSSIPRGREAMGDPQDLPLYFQGTSRSAKRRLGTAFSLLAKDIHQLLTSHGVKSTERSSLLQNLDALVAASRSGIS